ncbi:MAG: hypothetical protein ABIJ17_03760 [Patescibacteria group bacterium]
MKKNKLSDPLIFFVVGILVGAGLIALYFQTNSSIAGNQNSDFKEAAAYLKFKEIRESLTPSGIPRVYGKELDISFDKVQESIDIMVSYGPTYGQEGKKIILTGSDLERYIKIGASISCEYCCGVDALTREDGEAACGCAHSIMMRGLTAYLIQNHSNEFTDEEILEELEKWKTTFFPKQTLVKKLQELDKAGEPGIKEILEEFPEFMPQMIGGC